MPDATPQPLPKGAIAQLALPIPLDGFQALSQGLQAAYGDDLTLQLHGNWMLIFRPER